jgi:hypothetical protein
MSNYDTIKAAIDDVTMGQPSRAVQGKYVNDAAADPPHTFLAYVLGKSHTKGGGPPHDCVLGYQYAGPNTPDDDSKKWRCFKVDSFPANSLIQVAFVPPAATLTIPAPLSDDQLKWQNCVDIPGGRIARTQPYHA